MVSHVEKNPISRREIQRAKADSEKNNKANKTLT
jgi:hypothetical protein